jgi:acetylornithine/N-succinyldiaminopimelate aminotransferase
MLRLLLFLQAACKKYGTVLICDEIQCGYGRSGKFFAHQWLGIRPDMITVAKGIGNGFPMGGVLISPEFKPVYGQLGTTFGGNHLACTAALAVLDVFEKENLVENAHVVGEYLISQLKELQKRNRNKTDNRHLRRTWRKPHHGRASVPCSHSYVVCHRLRHALCQS